MNRGDYLVNVCHNRPMVAKKDPPDFKKTQRALHRALVELAKERALAGMEPIVTEKQAPMDAALSYINASNVKVAVEPERGGGVRNVEAMKDKGLALANALLCVSGELQDGPALRLLATFRDQVLDALRCLSEVSQTAEVLEDVLPRHGLGWALPECATGELRTHSELLRASLTARTELLERLTRETWHIDERERQEELVGSLTEQLGDAFNAREIAQLVDDGKKPDAPDYQRVRKRLKAREGHRHRRNWEGWFIGRSEDGQYIRMPSDTIERRPGKMTK